MWCSAGCRRRLEENWGLLVPLVPRVVHYDRMRLCRCHRPTVPETFRLLTWHSSIRAERLPRRPSAQVSATSASPSRSFGWEALCTNEVFVRCLDKEFPPAAIMSASAVFPDSLALMIAARPPFRPIVELRNHGALSTETDVTVCDASDPLGGPDPMCTRVSSSMQTCLSVSKQGSPFIHV